MLNKIIKLPQIYILLNHDESTAITQIINIYNEIKKKNILFQVSLRININGNQDYEESVNGKTSIMIPTSLFNGKEIIIKNIKHEKEKYKDEDDFVAINKMIVLKLLTNKSKIKNCNKILDKIKQISTIDHLIKEKSTVNIQNFYTFILANILMNIKIKKIFNNTYKQYINKLHLNIFINTHTSNFVYIYILLKKKKNSNILYSLKNKIKEKINIGGKKIKKNI